MTEINLSKLGAITTTSSVAYDLSLYEENQKKSQGSGARITSITNQRKRAEKAKAIVKAFCVCAFVGAVLGGIVLSATQLNELTTRASKLKKENEQVLSDQKRLQAEFDMMIDLTEVEDRAINELYMQKVEPAQVSFIALSQSDLGKASESTDNVIIKSINGIKNSVLNILEIVY